MSKQKIKEIMIGNGYSELPNSDMLFTPELNANLSIDFIAKYIMDITWTILLRYRKFENTEILRLFKLVLKKSVSRKYDNLNFIRSFTLKIMSYQTISEETFETILHFIDNNNYIKSEDDRTDLRKLFIKEYLEEQAISPELFIKYQEYGRLRYVDFKKNPWSSIENMPNSIKVLISFGTININE